jgi:hypothetical protein
MSERIWVIGGEFSDCEFTKINAGTEIVSGPFTDKVKAKMEWQRLTFRDHSGATERYTICIEPVLR